MAGGADEFLDALARIGRWVAELVDPAARALTWSLIAAHHQCITDQLKVPVTVATSRNGCAMAITSRCRSRRYVVTLQLLRRTVP
jgi:hypothetical protein